MTANAAKLDYDAQNKQLELSGDWNAKGLDPLLSGSLLTHIKNNVINSINGQAINNLDSAGALCINQLIEKLPEKKVKQQFKSEHQKLINLVYEKESLNLEPTKKQAELGFLYWLGNEFVRKVEQCDRFVILVGELTQNFLQAIKQLKRFEFKSIVRNIELTGLQALPIVGLLSFLIGVVLAYQMGIQLQTYGANIFIVYLTGLAVLREFGPLITAVIVAGRTSSSFTAQIGSMKVREEVDAIKTMGLSPVQLLVMPKVLGLLIAFPLLVLWADVFGILGSMVMAKFQLGIHYADYLTRLKETVGVKQLWLGLVKAPVFALLISLVGCLQGFLVKSSANSIGEQTTKSVVQAIFLIIIADSAFSIIYTRLGL